MGIRKLASNLSDGWLGTQTSLQVKQTEAEFKLLVGGRWETDIDGDRAFLYEFGLDSQQKQIFAVETTPTPWTYYSASDFRADFDGNIILESYIVGLRDEAATSDSQSTFTSTS